MRPPVHVRAVCQVPGEAPHGGQGHGGHGGHVARQDGQVTLLQMSSAGTWNCSSLGRLMKNVMHLAARCDADSNVDY